MSLSFIQNLEFKSTYMKLKVKSEHDLNNFAHYPREFITMSQVS